MAGYRLIPGRPEFAEMFHRWRTAPATVAANPIKNVSVDVVRNMLKTTGFDLSDQNFENYRFFLEHNDVVVANASLKSISWDQRYGEIGYGVDPEQFGKGYGTLVTRMAINHIFANTNLERLFGTVSVTNTASKRIMEKLGFIQEGLLREHFIIEGRRLDQYFFGLLRKEWQG